jgi:hypothetical protein
MKKNWNREGGGEGDGTGGEEKEEGSGGIVRYSKLLIATTSTN